MLHLTFGGYLVASALVLALCWGVWRLFFEQNTSPTFSRIAILSIYGLSLSVPFIVASVPVVVETAIPFPVPEAPEFHPVVATTPATASTDYASLVSKALIWIYFTGVAALTLLTLRNLWRLARIKNKAERRQPGIYFHDNATLSTFSWLRDIYIYSKSANTAPGELDILIAHESAHIDMWHWVDLILAQAMVIFQWFNPAAWLSRRQLQRVHEYQADARVLAAGVDNELYQMLLIKNISGSRFTGLTDGLNNCSLKQRIIMMQKKPGNRSVWIRAIAVLAVATGSGLLLHQPAVAALIGSIQPLRQNVGGSQPMVLTIKNDDGANKTVTNFADIKWTIDGREATAEEVEALSPDKIKSIEMDKSGTEPQGKISLKKDIEYGAMIYGTPTVDDLVVVAYVGSKTDDGNKTPTDSNTTENCTDEIREVDGAYTGAETLPEYEGGYANLMRDLALVTRFPQSELKADVDARVVVQFMVKADGNIANLKIVNSQGEAFDNAALEAVRRLPGKWKPGTIGGKPVNVWYSVPIHFMTKS